MGKLTNCLFLIFFVAFAATPALAQLSGTYSIDNTGGGDYTTFGDAITDLETNV